MTFTIDKELAADEQNAHHVTFSGVWVTRGPVYEAIAFI